MIDKTNLEDSFTIPRKHIVEDEITFNKKDLGIYIEVKDEGDNMLYEGEGHSLVANFMRGLFNLYSGSNLNSSGFYFEGGRTITTIASVTGGTRINFSGGVLSYAIGDKITITGATGNLSLNGTWTVINSGSAMNYVNINAPYNASYTANTGGLTLWVQSTGNFSPNNEILRGASLWLCYDASASATTLDQQTAPMVINGTTVGTLTYNSQIVAIDTTDTTINEIAITRTYSNQTAQTINANGIAFNCYLYPGTARSFLISYDPISNIAVASGKTITINYRLRSTLANNAILTQGFFRLLYNGLADVGRTIQNLANIAVTASTTRRENNFRVASTGGLCKVSITANVYGKDVGVIIGRGTDGTIAGTANVAPSDYNVVGRINHGKGSNEMYDYGCMVDDFFLDSTECSFVIYDFFENLTANPIAVTEYGIANGVNSGSDTSPVNSCLTYRKKLAAPVTVNAGEVLKVAVKMKLTL